jgi:predicted CXXCH cytochrome family protein
MRRLFEINTRARLRILFWSVGLALLAAVLAGFSAGSVTAASAPQTVAAPQSSNDTCLYCHQKANILTTVGDEQILVSIDATAFSDSAHGKAELACTDCHTDISSFPHPEYAKTGLREFGYSLYQATQAACQGCHDEEVSKAMSGVHQQTLETGNHNAAMCADCHNPHYSGFAAGRDEVPDVCARCHSEIAATYKESVHGAALIDEGNLDVPNCNDCHGNHNIIDPRTVEFRNDIPLLCARCHTDAGIMDKYGISTNVLNTYVADYHGTTVTLFEQNSPDLPTNKPVCIDCHGTHNISKTDNPQTGIGLKENLLKKCQRCHPDATANFPDAWMSHYDASPEKYPLVYYVNLFYKFFIPAVIGGMLLFVITDIIRRAIHRGKGVAH